MWGLFLFKKCFNRIEYPLRCMYSKLCVILLDGFLFLQSINNHKYFVQMVGCLLISIGVYGRTASIVINLPIIGGILACGVILILISLIGLAGAVKHHQVTLFFVSFLRKITKNKQTFTYNNTHFHIKTPVHLKIP